MDLKAPGNLLYLVGLTRNELGGSHYALVEGLRGGQVPAVDARLARQVFAAMHRAIEAGLVRACHDLSEGGLAVAAAEMAFAGGLGARLDLDRVPADSDATHPAVLLFSESNSRFLCEVPPAHSADFQAMFQGLPCACLGKVTEDPWLEIQAQRPVVRAPLEALKEAWQRPLRW